MAAESPIRVLLVEDNPIDVRATVRAIEKLDIGSRIDVVADGLAALDHLREASEVGRRPDLVLLDLDLPGKHGREVLAEIKADADLRRIPVVVLTTSSDHADILGVYDLGANAFITKPVGLEAWRQVVEKIDDFWFSVVQLPPS